MLESEAKKYRVVLFQRPAPSNDLGEMTETELYGYLGTKVGEPDAKVVFSELEQRGIAFVDIGEHFGLKTCVEIRLVEQ